MPDHAWVDLIGTARSTDERSGTARHTPGSLDRAVAEARGGDVAAFRLLYQEFQPLLLRYLRFLVGDGADDIAERTWQHAASGLGARPEGTGARGTWSERLGTWLRGLFVRRESLDAQAGYDDFRGWLAGFARKLARDERAERDERAGTARTRNDPAAYGHDATGAALSLIAGLPPDEAEAVLLRSVLGLDARRAARVSGQSPRALSAAAHRGLSALAGQL